MRYYTTEVLSANQELTPEGFLLCKNVPIARTGQQLYMAGEVPITPAPGSAIIRVDRTADNVFRPETLASFEGKAVTLDHPVEDVSPANWHQLAKGITQNVRRGAGWQHDLVVADLLITDAAAIRQVRDKSIFEVSCGYDADYEETAPGFGRQTSIVGNHVALVEKGRCGTRCAIGDSDPMTKKKNSFFDAIRRAFKANDEAAFEEALKDAPTADEAADESEEEKKKREAAEAAKTGDALTKFTDALAAIETRLAAIESRDAKAKDEDEDDAGTADEDEDKKATADADPEDETEEDKKKAADKKARDSAALFAQSQDVFARAEILSPGLQLPTRDAALDPIKFQDSLCALRRLALANAYANPATRDAVSPLVAPVDLAKLTCDALGSTFIGASEIVRNLNNRAQTTVTFDSGKSAAGIASTIQSMNQRNAQFWNRQ